MGTERGQVSHEHLLRHLRNALNHLHDPAYLRHSPLATLFGVADRSDMPQTLRRVLVTAIESLQPNAEEPPDSRAWRMYESLAYRYLEQYEQEDVADQMGMSVRQLRREQRVALEALTYTLCEQFGVGADHPDGAVRGTEVSALPGADPVMNEELNWLKGHLPERPADLKQILPDVLHLVRPLADKHQVQIEATIDDDITQIVADAVALRQILLSLLGVALPRAASCGLVRVTVTALPWEVAVRLDCPGPPSVPDEISGDDHSRLDVARQLAGMCGARLHLAMGDGAFSGTLLLPAVERLPVLAIDDNADTLRLLQRYTAGTRYRLVGVQDPESAVALAQELRPQIIVLDVMMPRVDGWEVLGRLCQHPLTGHVPIVVCTILPQEELALSLGAKAFVRKPITRQAFLAALDERIGLTQRGSH